MLGFARHDKLGENFRRGALGGCPRTVISSDSEKSFSMQVADSEDFSLRYAQFEMTENAFSDSLLAGEP